MLAAAPLGAPLLCILWVVFFNHSIKPFQATRSENDEEFKTGGEGDGGRRLGQRAAPRGPPGKEAPSAPSRPAAPRRAAAAAARASAPVTSRGLSGTYVTPRGRCRCSCPPPGLPPPEGELVSEAPQLPQRPGRDKPARARRPSPPQVLPAPPPPSRREAALRPAAGRQRPGPAAGRPRTVGRQRSPAPPPAGRAPSPPGSPRLPTWPRKSGRSPGGEEAPRGKVSLTLRRPAPAAEPPAAWVQRPGPRCSPGALQLRLPPQRPAAASPAALSPHRRGHTPRRRRGTGSGTPPARGGAAAILGGAGRREGLRRRRRRPRGAVRGEPPCVGRAGAGPAPLSPRVAPGGRRIRRTRERYLRVCGVVFLKNPTFPFFVHHPGSVLYVRALPEVNKDGRVFRYLSLHKPCIAHGRELLASFSSKRCPSAWRNDGRSARTHPRNTGGGGGS